MTKVNFLCSVPPKNWEKEDISIFFQELGKRINEWHEWRHVSNPKGGFLGFYWHFVRCRNKNFEYYLQLQNLDLKIRIIMKEKKN